MAIPTNYVLTVYLTEAAAKAGLVDSAVSGEKALAVDTYGKILLSGQAAGYDWWTHTKYWYRIESNEPVTEFYIDWDDGEDNDPKAKANYSSIKLATPSFVGITSHIYTGNSTTNGGYFPKIRCKSVDGFWSKFYQNILGGFNHSGIDLLQGDTTLSGGRNDKYKIESVNVDGIPSTNAIPALYPSIKPPVAVLKTDRKRIYAGIDNGYLRGSDGDLDGSLITLVAAPSPSGNPRTGVEVEVTYITTGATGSVGNRGDIMKTTLSLGGTSTLSNVTKILKVELLSLLEDSVDFGGGDGTGTGSGTPSATKLYPGEKMVLVAGSLDYSQQTIAEVSLGNPIVILDDPRYGVTYDLTESFARTSEQSLSNYYLDDGKVYLNNGYATDNYIQGAASPSAAYSDVLTDTNGVLELEDGVAKRNYAFDIYYNYLDTDHRWLPKQILARGQVKVTSPFAAVAGTTQYYSSLEHWRNESHSNNYSDDMEGVAGYNWPSDMSSANLLVFKGSHAIDRWTDLEDLNRKVGKTTNYIMQSGSNDYYSFSGSTSIDDAGRMPAMLLCARDSKWTKQFFKTVSNRDGNNDAGDVVLPGNLTASNGHWRGAGHMNTRVQVLYTGYESSKKDKPMWKPFKFMNHTSHPDYKDTSWLTDGAFEWEEPEDWASIDPETIPDKFWPRGDYFTAADNNSWAYSDDANVSTTSEIHTIVVSGDNITSNSEVAHVGVYSGSNDITDGLAIVRASNPATVIGRYFTFSKQQHPSDVEYYAWFRQAPTGERFTIDTTTDTTNIPASNIEVRAGYESVDGVGYDFDNLPSGVSLPVSDGLAVVNNNTATQVVGKYFTFSTPSTDYYCWFQQAATKEQNSFEIDCDHPLEFSESGSPAYAKYIQLNRHDDNGYIFWFNTGSENSPTVEEHWHEEVDISGVTSGDFSAQIAAILATTINNVNGGDKFDAAVAGLSGVSGGVSLPNTVDIENRVAGASIDARMSENMGNNGGGTPLMLDRKTDSNNDSLRGADGKDLAVDPQTTHAATDLAGKTGIMFSGEDGYSNASYGLGTNITNAINTALGFTAATHSSGIVTVTMNGLNYGHCASVADGTSSSTPSSLDLRTLFTLTTTYDGKAQAVSPSPTYQDLTSKIALPIDYDDGDSDTSIAEEIRTQIATTGIGAVRSGTTVTLTQPSGGVVTNPADGVGSAGTLTLSTDFTFATTQEGSLVEDYFEEADRWNATNKKYGLMFIIESDSAAAYQADEASFETIQYTWPCSNSHSALIDLIDPMCVSLNGFSIVQSLSFIHKGKYQIVKDRLGKSDIRKIGAEGGAMKFGGIDLATETARVKFYGFQTNSTPVYMDVEHHNGDISRFFGVITNMSEDHPTGKVIPKFAVNMEVSHMITMNSSGSILSDGYISLGGDISEPTFLQ